MPLFESRYKAAAKTELERDIRRLEEKDKAAQTKVDFDNTANMASSNLNFAQRLNLISAEQYAKYKERIEKATQEYERMQRTESQEERVDDFENPRERTDRYMKMEEVQAQIAQERAENNSQTQQAEHSNASPSRTEEDAERSI